MLELIDRDYFATLAKLRNDKAGASVALDAEAFPKGLRPLADDAAFFYPFFEGDVDGLNEEYLAPAWAVLKVFWREIDEAAIMAREPCVEWTAMCSLRAIVWDLVGRRGLDPAWEVPSLP